MNKAVEAAHPYAEAVQQKTERLVQQTKEGQKAEGGLLGQGLGKVQVSAERRPPGETRVARPCQPAERIDLQREGSGLRLRGFVA